MKINGIDLGDFPVLLAPMEDVSDPPFRILCKENGADMMYTEFISVEGLVRDAVKSKIKLDISEAERPVGIQIFGADIENMVRAAQMVEEVGPDLIDINFGCPVSKVAGRGAGAGMLREPDRMVEMTRRIVEAVRLPVTVKTRLGWDDKTQIVGLAERLQDTGIRAMAIHGRTRNQMYKGEADWRPIAAVKNNPRMHIPIIGNGDVDSPEKARIMRDEYGLDGCMIGRAAIGNPWIFNQVKHFLKTGEHLPLPTIDQRIEAARRHLLLAMDWKGERLGVLETRKHYGNYFKGVPNFKEYRVRLCTCESYAEFGKILQEIREIFTFV